MWNFISLLRLSFSLKGLIRWSESVKESVKIPLVCSSISFWWSTYWFPQLLKKSTHSSILLYLACPDTDILFSFFKVYLFILREQARARTHKWGRGRERGRERIPSKICAEHGAWHRARSHNLEIMTLADIKSQMLNWLSHPGVPLPMMIFLTFFQ